MFLSRVLWVTILVLAPASESPQFPDLREGIIMGLASGLNETLTNHRTDLQDRRFRKGQMACHGHCQCEGLLVSRCGLELGSTLASGPPCKSRTASVKSVQEEYSVFRRIWGTASEKIRKAFSKVPGVPSARCQHPLPSFLLRSRIGVRAWTPAPAPQVSLRRHQRLCREWSAP